MGTIAITLTLFFALFAGAVGGVTTTASASLPGAPFDSVKLALEETSLFFTPDPAQQAERHLLAAQERCQRDSGPCAGR